jgi:predicted ATPase
MDAIRIQNLRSLADTGFVELKPITLLLGENSSGKSTFLRTFPLLRQSVEARTSGSILWYGQFVDFDNFHEALNKKAAKQEMTFHFRLTIPERGNKRRVGRRSLSVLEDMVVSILLNIKGDSGQKVTWLSECQINFFEHSVKIEFDDKGEVKVLVINSNEYRDEYIHFITNSTRGLLPGILDTWGIIPKKSSYEGLISKINEYCHSSIDDEKVYRMASGFGIGSSTKMLKQMQTSSGLGTTWQDNISTWTEENEEFIIVRDLIIANAVIPILSWCDDYITEFVVKSNYIAPLRATAERDYRYQDLAVDEVDFQGKNMAMFLRSLTETEREEFSRWTQKYFGFTLKVSSNGSHISIKLRERGSEIEFNLADMGFGFSQVLPVLTQLWVLSYAPKRRRSFLRRQDIPICLAIEQPELHLHPRLQAKLADAFLAAIKAAQKAKLDLRLVIETHSDTIINRFGHRIANQDMDPQDINVVLFDKKGPNASTEIRFARYDEEGYLTNWPFGFFEPDEV